VEDGYDTGNQPFVIVDTRDYAIENRGFVFVRESYFVFYMPQPASPAVKYQLYKFRFMYELFD
jgi:hypothetical protein